MRLEDVKFVVTKSGCHEATVGYWCAYGYPHAMINGKNKTIARHIYEAAFGPLPAGLVIRHRCDNPKCVNVAHLIAGTHQDNVRDRVERGRSAIGERNGRSKLTEADVLEIRHSSESMSALARRFGVDRRAIYQVRYNLTWRYLLKD